MTKLKISANDRAIVKKEIKNILINQAKLKRTLFYYELCKRIKQVRVPPDDDLLKDLLGEISAESYRKKKCLLSVYAVTKDSGMPGKGFFTFAKELGCDVSSIGRERFFKTQIDLVHKSYRDPHKLTFE